MYTIIQFSPTGNAAQLATKLADELGGDTKVHALEHSDPSLLENNQHLIIVYAIHAFNAPRTVKRFVKNLPKGIYNKVSLIGVGCNTSWVNGAVSKDIKCELERKLYTIIADEVLAMPLTFIMAFPDEVAKQQILEANLKIKEIAKDIREERISQKNISLKSHVINFVGRAEPIASRFFGLELHAKKGCTQCGLCVRECPEKNIKMDDKGKIHFGFKCLMCMRCIYNCPKKVITPRISKFIPIRKGYTIKKHIENQSSKR